MLEEFEKIENKKILLEKAKALRAEMKAETSASGLIRDDRDARARAE